MELSFTLAPGTYFSTDFGFSASWGRAKFRLPPGSPSARPTGAGIGSYPRKQGGPNRSKNNQPKLRAKIKEVEDRSVESECMVAFLKEQVLSLELLVYGALSYWCMRPYATSVCGLNRSPTPGKPCRT